jgi:hypothetical protein
LSGSDQIFTNDKTSIAFKIIRTNSIQTINLSDWRVYPNPATDQLFVEIKQQNQFVTGQIFDAYGRGLKTVLLTTGITAIDVRDLSAGVYFVKVGAGLIKFVVE